MPSKAREAFKENASDIERLLEIHEDIGGDAQGRRYRLEVLNKSAIVLITAFWEAYCEDLAAEAVKHLVDNCEKADKLPLDLRKRIAKELKDDRHELAVWTLAGDAWKGYLISRLQGLADERSKRLNTPKAGSIVELFDTALGLKDISTRWRWQGMSMENAKSKLDGYVELRGAIAHRGKHSESCKKAHVTDYFSHVKSLVSETDRGVNSYVRQVTGKRLWKRGG
jgi:RiboL-PSP-HEPN